MYARRGVSIQSLVRRWINLTTIQLPGWDNTTAKYTATSCAVTTTYTIKGPTSKSYTSSSISKRDTTLFQLHINFQKAKDLITLAYQHNISLHIPSDNKLYSLLKPEKHWTSSVNYIPSLHWRSKAVHFELQLALQQIIFPPHTGEAKQFTLNNSSHCSWIIITTHLTLTHSR